MQYRCEATSVEGFVQQVAVAYVSNGYFFFVAGCVPKDKDPQAVDEKIIGKYDIGISKWAKARRKQAGMANLQYLRFERFFLILATHGRNQFFEEEEKVIRDVRRFPIKFSGYSISFRGGHASVRIEPTEYKMIKAYFLQFAAHRNVEWLETEFARLPYQPYAPIRLQLNSIRRAVNRERRLAGYDEVSQSRVSGKRKVVRPFEQTPFANDSFRATFLVRPGTNGFVDLAPDTGDELNFPPKQPAA